MRPLSKSANTASINIDSLGHEVRNFVIEYEQGSRKASQLVSNEALRVREVVERQSGRTEAALREHVTRASAKFERKLDHQIEQIIREQLQERLLRSLKYPGMNERSNQVEHAHAHTFRWLFADANADNSSHSCDEGIIWTSFTDWLQSDLSIYWIMGKPGSGKSTLAKFILSEPRFKIALGKWRRDAIIASHYFWRPGALLQRSIKGMLCSIIYQLVLTLPKVLEYVSANVAGLRQKDGDTDWSVPELERLCLGLITHCGTPLCLLIDGLDECGPEDNHLKLLDTLDRIRLPNVKIIASGRNEPIFEKRFRHEPQLRVQDLTAGDLQIYAIDMLAHDVEDEIREELVKNAEGVFLWLALAIQSINRGFSNGDSLSDLHKRIRSLPRGLNDLYKDMWERLNDDSDIYRKSGALYIKLAMAYQDRTSSREIGWTPLGMMLASFATSHIAFVRPNFVSASQLLKKCEEFHKRVEVRCAGLLRLYGKPGHHPVKKFLGDSEKALLEYADNNSTFGFIHRSARDFLVDTVEGQNILRHDNTSSENINIRCISASLSAIEVLVPILGDYAQEWFSSTGNWQFLTTYLRDMSSIAEASDSVVGELVSRCFELYCSSILIIFLGDAHPEHRAAFFAVAAIFPSLNRYCISIIENQLVGSGIRSAILLSVGISCHGCVNLKLVRRLLSLPDVDVNLKCPLVVPRGVGGWRGPDDIGPLDHIKESPFTRLLGSGLEQIDWTVAKWLPRHRYQFFGLISGFASQGADFRSTLFLVIPLGYPSETFATEKWVGLERQVGDRRFLQFAGRVLFKWGRRNDDQVNDDQSNDGVLCVVALQATTVIQGMLASLPTIDTGHHSLGKDAHSLREGDYGASDLKIARQLLSQKCQEYGCGANDRVVGFLEPSGNLRDMPYRQVSDRDSAHIMEMVLENIFEDNSRGDYLEAACREAVTRSPFSSIGFRDYLKDLGCFDELDAYKLISEYRKGKVTSTTACAFEIWQ